MLTSGDGDIQNSSLSLLTKNRKDFRETHGFVQHINFFEPIQRLFSPGKNIKLEI